jgi:hypothetical protein
MNLYRISQEVNTDLDTYDAAIVAAASADEARKIHPRGDASAWDGVWGTWAADPKDVDVELIGTAKPGTEAGVILASFNAG